MCVTLWNERVSFFTENRRNHHVVHFKGVKSIGLTQDSPALVKSHFKAFVDTVITVNENCTDVLLFYKLLFSLTHQ